jgi:2-iminobutanoate/2-iminopropanoate deaminase
MIDFIGQPEPNSIRPFSRATRAGGLIFVSGHSAPHDPANGIERGGTPVEQVRNALTFIDGLLRAEGSSLQRIVQVTMLITDLANYAACNEEYVRHCPDGLPARHTTRFGVSTEAMVGFSCMALAVDG